MREQRYQGADIILTRKYGQQVTTGTLKVFDSKGSIKFECKTIELPWRENQSFISCIPEATYQWEKVAYSTSFKYQHIHIKAVPKRSGIKVHIGNYVRELRGCIAPGDAHRDIDRDGIIDVINSKDTLQALLRALPEKGTIQITSAP
jgi:hypothetical protein